MASSAQLHLVGDFNLDTLGRYLAHTALDGAAIDVAPPGPVQAALSAGPPAPDWIGVVWTRAEMISAAFQRALSYEQVDVDDVLAEVEAFASAVARYADRARAVFVTTWVSPPFVRGWGMLDRRPGLGVADLLARMNVALADALRSDSSVFLLDAGRWLTAAGSRGWSQKAWYAAKCPFSPGVLAEAADDIAAAIDGLTGRARRVVVLDLDEVLWGGSVGEAGPLGVRLGGHDHVGEAFVDFQRALKALTRRGVLLAIASKNDEAVALDAIDRHPEMQLRRDDFAAWRIDWRDKAANVAAVLADLNLGAESAVFIDDQAIERERVRSAVPGILVPEWPADPCLFREALGALRCFDAPTITIEDRARAGMAAAERSRRASAAASGTVDEWLQSLDVRVTVEPLDARNLDRATQLLNKTNQMNLSTRRLTAADLSAWAAAPDRLVLTFRVADRFGDSGLTGLVGLQFAGSEARLVDFLLSCRVMGRRVEETMLHVAIAHARRGGAAILTADLIATPRNGPCLEFFKRSGLSSAGATRFTWDTASPYACPAAVTVSEPT